MKLTIAKDTSVLSEITFLFEVSSYKAVTGLVYRVAGQQSKKLEERVSSTADVRNLFGSCLQLYLLWQISRGKKKTEKIPL